MMTFLLVGINSRYNHVNLAIRSIEAYVRAHMDGNKQNSKKKIEIKSKYFTFTEPLSAILRSIVTSEPSVVLFSVYIWNIRIVSDIIPELRKILPSVVIGAGGPEVSYNPHAVLTSLPALDFVMSGEGEQTVYEIETMLDAAAGDRDTFLSRTRLVPGVWTRSDGTAVQLGGARSVFPSLDCLPFPYEDASGTLAEGIDPQNSIIYYESSRGCPFHCSYCLSSLDKSVRFLSLPRVFHDLQFFLDRNVHLVKFVDRTFDINESRYISIWQYIIDHWNGKTKFHFEIAAEQLSDRSLQMLQQVPAGMMQFEIGIQSTNVPTLRQVGRDADLKKISLVLARIPETIHVHLDLIAGLPFESLSEFSQSFNDTISYIPDMLQLGFLKILRGTAMELYAQKTKGYEWLSIAPYEILASPWITYREMGMIKDLEEVVDIYYNQQLFVFTMRFLVLCANEKKLSMYDFFSDVARAFKNQGLAGTPHNVRDYFLFINEFFESVFSGQLSVSFEASLFSANDRIILRELLRFDFIRREKPGMYPVWYVRRYDKDAHRNALEKYSTINSVRDAFIGSSYEEFLINPLLKKPVVDGIVHAVLFLYNAYQSGAASKTDQHYLETCFILLS